MIRIILIALLFVNCAVKKEGNSDLPSWYLNPPKSNLSALYGVGVSDEKGDAVNIALNDISGKISIEISGKFQTDKQEARVNELSEYESYASQRISSNTEVINFTNYEVEKTEQHGHFIYVLVKVSKAEFKKNYEDKINKRHAEILRLGDKLGTLSPVQALSRLFKLRAKIAENNFDIEILNTVVGLNVKIKSYLKDYDALLKREQEFKNKLLVKISSNGSDNRIVDVLRKALNDEGISIVNNAGEKKSYAILRVETETKHKKIYGSNIAIVQVSLKLIENFGTQTSANNFTLKGNSAIDSIGAIRMVIRSLEIKIKEDGILKTLGL
jgi:hypothetical protein